MTQWANNFGTKTFEGFMKKLLSDLPYEFKVFNRKATIAIWDKKVVEIVLSTRGTSGHYQKLVVSIIHKDNGMIASEAFNFSDYLMDGWEQAGSDKAPLVIDHCGTDWYMNGPTSKAIKNLVKRISEYIEIYD